MSEIASLIERVLNQPDDAAEAERVRTDVEALCRRFPLYASRWND